MDEHQALPPHDRCGQPHPQEIQAANPTQSKTHSVPVSLLSLHICIFRKVHHDNHIYFSIPGTGSLALAHINNPLPVLH